MGELSQLVEDFGSPMYVYQLDTLRAAREDLRCVLPEPSSLYYSLKANPHPLLAQELRVSGCKAEISSTGELGAALQAGFKGADCLFTGPAKGRLEIAAALTAGVRRFSVESAADLRRVGAVAAKANVTAECLVRINSRSVGASGLRMGGVSQFGVEAEEVLHKPDQFTGVEGADVVGAHFFPLGNARDEGALIAELTASIALAACLRDQAGMEMSVVDLGGGFAAPYAQPGERPRYPLLRASLETALDAHLTGWREGRPEVAFESGRYLVAECGTLLCTTVDVKSAHDSTFVLLDSGIHHLGGMAGLGRLLRPAATPCSDAGTVSSESVGRVTLAGPLCTPADVIGRDIPVRHLNAGDLLAFPNTGAYGLTASLLAFLSRPAPAEIVLRGNVVESASQLNIVRTSIEAKSVPTTNGPLGL
ncbi:type III PLP-dependent enzyme [Streptomyces sp. SPB162]|uniref:type III PLP-dependent enzyme n=1 Tax=Streptomyces sp. SPB162 TaxID=2940560 RepID=UPI00240736E8|nr:type III PLP-dependent enzyme [Streptomyces sp. SPB162]MDF9811454.1 diaminopimelate decarboxylase [Streptomyces sp. SPB162]